MLGRTSHKSRHQSSNTLHCQAYRQHETLPSLHMNPLRSCLTIFTRGRHHLSDGHTTLPTLTWHYFDYWGKGTKVTVGAKLPSSIYPLHQCGSADSRGDISLGCIASGFSPLDALSFNWSDSNGNVLPDFHQYSPVMVSGSTMMVSHITVKAADWNSQKSYTCAAHHQTLGPGKSETLQKPGIVILYKLSSFSTLGI
ncbi:Ig heavy chain Mem5-like [Paramormyrops kingsleyae]|uniref:Ig heavy chain Mem5-like n=1 Tax=Paramormyrops kingsleyae TaxID=1676925 RepID=UPI003B97CE41